MNPFTEIEAAIEDSLKRTSLIRGGGGDGDGGGGGFSSFFSSFWALLWWFLVGRDMSLWWWNFEGPSGAFYLVGAVRDFKGGFRTTHVLNRWWLLGFLFFLIFFPFKRVFYLNNFFSSRSSFHFIRRTI